MAERRTVAAGALTVGLAALTGWVWADHSSAPPAASAAQPAVQLDGGSLFEAKGCSSCHDGPDHPARIGIAPSLAAAPTWAGGRREGMSAEDYVRESIRDPGAFTSPAFTPNGPTTAMPGIAVSDAELSSLVAYLLDR